MSSPCKLPEYLACGVPIVSTRVSDIPNTLSVTPQALCKPDDRDDMIRAIRWQLKNRKVVPLPENLSWYTVGGKLKNLLNHFIPNPNVRDWLASIYFLFTIMFRFAI